MRNLLALAAALVGVATAAPAAPPVIVLSTALSAGPSSLSSGSAGPLNRYLFELSGFPERDPAAQVLCVYPTHLVYRCRFERQDTQAPQRSRVIVTIPDLDLGRRVVVRFLSSGGSLEFVVQLSNAPQVVHEIEALPLTRGGQHTIGSDGLPRPNLAVISERATTLPAMASSTLGAPTACDQIHAQWVSASATDPLFTSEFGALMGSVILTKPANTGSPLRPDNLPQWTFSYPMSANRVQFIAHYEVIYRVGLCSDRVVTSG
jgi:hypothetical protein